MYGRLTGHGVDCDRAESGRPATSTAHARMARAKADLVLTSIGSPVAGALPPSISGESIPKPRRHFRDAGEDRRPCDEAAVGGKPAGDCVGGHGAKKDRRQAGSYSALPGPAVKRSRFCFKG